MSEYEILPRNRFFRSMCGMVREWQAQDVVLFGEMLPPGAFEHAALRASQSDLCFVVGTSALVYPAASLPEIAKNSGAYLCEINPERTGLSSLCDEVINGPAGEIIPLIGEILPQTISAGKT